MTTLLISENFPPRTGGSGRWFWEIYRRAPRSGYLIAAGEAPFQGDFDRTHDLRIVRMPLTLRQWGVASLEGFGGYARAIQRLRRLVSEHRVTMIHCGRCLPEGVMALALQCLTGVPYVCYVHGEDVATATLSREHRWLARRALAGARFVIANSRNTAQMLSREWALPAERVHLLHPGVDVDRFIPARRDPAVRSGLGWNDRPVVLTVGRLQLRKGHDRLIAALPAIRRTHPDILYAIVGDGEQREALRGLVARERLGEHVQFLGEVGDDRLVRCYQQCDLFVLPNRQVGRDIEGFGMVLLEAQACGRPVVAGASGGTAETMRIPETGCVVPCDAPGELAAIVTALLSDPGRLACMGTSARGWAVDRFDWEILARRAEDLFRMASGRPGPPALSP